MFLVFFSLLFSSFSFAQVLECDPANLERECMATVCTPNPFVPQSAEGLAQELEAFPLSAEMAVSFKGVKDALEKSREALTGFGGALQIKSEAKYLNPEQVKLLIGENVVLVNGEFLSNPFQDDKEFPAQEARSYLTKLRKMEKPAEVLRATVGQKVPKEYKEAVLSFMDELIVYADQIGPVKKTIEGLRVKVASDVPLTDFEYKASNLFSIGSSLTKDALNDQHPALEKILTWKVNKLKTVNLESKVKTVSQSCQVQSYLSKKILDQLTLKALDERKLEVVTRFREKFLPLLSKKTASKLKKLISAKTFEIGDVGSVPLLIYLPHEDSSLIEAIGNLETTMGARCSSAGHFGDQYRNGEKQVHISPLSMVLGSGSMVMAHELGHLIQGYILQSGSEDSRRKFAETMKCVDSFHPGTKKVNFSEDFADVFAAKLGFNDAQIMCELNNADRLKFGVEGSLYMTRAGDPHSGYLFRALNLKINSGLGISGSCQQLIDVSTDKPVKCEL